MARRGTRCGGGRTSGRNDGGRTGGQPPGNPQPSKGESVTGSAPTVQADLGNPPLGNGPPRNNIPCPETPIDKVNAAGADPVMIQQLLQFMGDMKRQNDHLQAQVDYLIQGQALDDENWKQ